MREDSLEILEVKDAFCYEAQDRRPLLVKAPTDGEFEGYASVFKVVDLHNEVVEAGAFARSLKHKKTFPVLYAHSQLDPIGQVVEAREDDKGLKIKGKLSLGVTRARDVVTLMRDEVIRSLSIGYRVVKDEFERESGVRHLKEIDLWEVSAVVFPANPKARITDVKAVVPYQNLPLASVERGWDAAAAVRRVRAWAGAEEEPNEKYRRAFVWYDREAQENFGAYKLPIADVLDGTLTAIPRGVFAAAAVVQGARGGVNIPERDMPGVRAHLARYYRRLDRTPPWEGQGSFQLLVRHVVDLGEHASEEDLSDLLAFASARSNSKPFDWLDDARGPDRSGRVSGELFEFLDEYVSSEKGK